MNFTMKPYSLVFFLLITQFTFAQRVTLQLQSERSECAASGQIKVTAAGAVGNSIVYEVIPENEPTLKIIQTNDPIFTGLPANKYTVNVYDQLSGAGIAASGILGNIPLMRLATQRGWKLFIDLCN